MFVRMVLIFVGLLLCSACEKETTEAKKPTVPGEYMMDQRKMGRLLEQKIAKLPPAQQSKGQIALTMLKAMSIKMNLYPNGKAKFTITHSMQRSNTPKRIAREGEWKMMDNVVYVTAYNQKTHKLDVGTCTFDETHLTCQDEKKKETILFLRP